jgi:hypothetical protein
VTCGETVGVVCRKEQMREKVLEERRPIRNEGGENAGRETFVSINLYSSYLNKPFWIA